jgi:hypothetical protein
MFRIRALSLLAPVLLLPLALLRQAARVATLDSRGPGCVAESAFVNPSGVVVQVEEGENRGILPESVQALGVVRSDGCVRGRRVVLARGLRRTVSRGLERVMCGRAVQVHPDIGLGISGGRKREGICLR